MGEVELTEKEKQFVYGSGTGSPEEQKPTDPPFRLSTKESAKGFRYYEWTVRGESFSEMRSRNEEVRKYVNEMRAEENKKDSGDIQSEL